MYAQKHASIISVRKRTFLFAHDSSHSDISLLSCRKVLTSIIPKVHSPAWMYSRLLSVMLVLYTCLYLKQPAVWGLQTKFILHIHATQASSRTAEPWMSLTFLWSPASEENLVPSKLSLSYPCRTYLPSVAHPAKGSPWEIAGLCVIGSHVHSCIHVPLVIPRKMQRSSQSLVDVVFTCQCHASLELCKPTPAHTPSYSTASAAQPQGISNGRSVLWTLKLVCRAFLSKIYI